MVLSTLRLQTLPNFGSSWYAGVYCGVTVFSVALSIERSTLFYMISLPIVDTMSRMGLSTFLRFDSTSNLYVGAPGRGCLCVRTCIRPSVSTPCHMLSFRHSCTDHP